mgnify:CR=1 FL=1
MKLKGLEKEIQKVTDDAVKHVDEMTAHKEKRIDGTFNPVPTITGKKDSVGTAGWVYFHYYL